MLALLMLLACDDDGSGAASTVTFANARSGSSATTVQGALDELYVRCAANTAGAETPAPALSDATVDLTGRIQLLELRQAEQSANGGYGADKVSYDPRLTTLSGRTVQQALDELEARVTRLERGSVDNGAPGPALFELRDKRGNLVQADGPKGQPGGHPGGQPPPMGGGGQPGASKGPTPPK